MKIFYPCIFLLALGFLQGCGSSHDRTTSAEEASHFFSDPKIEQCVDSLMQRMTLDEKIGQLVLYSSHFTTTGPTLPKNVEEAIRNGTCGNIFNAHVPSYNRELQRIAVEETRMGIPLLFGYDVIHGMKTIFPINLGMSCSWDIEGIKNSARVAAREAIAAGLNWTFSPMVDVTRDPRWGRVSEGSGEDTYLGSLIAAAMVEGYQGPSAQSLASDSTILACIKHFAAYGAPQAGRDYQTVDITDRTLREVYLPPYQAGIDAGVGSVMSAFNDIDAVPATASHYLMTDILRKEWGFNGFVVTDFTAINELVPHGVAADSMEAGALALNAGINMDLQGDIYHRFLKKLVEQKKVSLRQVDRMCAGVLRVKCALGLFDDPYRYLDTTAAAREFYKPENLAAARDMARKSIVLLKNDNRTLPITTGRKIALIGPFANSRIDLLGSWYGQGDTSHVVSILQGMQERFGRNKIIYAQGAPYEQESRIGFRSALQAARNSDVAVVAVGLPGSWSGEATSMTTISLPKIQQELIAAIRTTGKPLVLLLLNGRPLDLSWESSVADAIVEAWYPGTEGGHAVADILSGDFNPCGKLTMTFPRTLGQVPIHYDMKNTGRPFTPNVGEQHYVSRYIDLPNNTPLYPFGYGLSYTTFEYSDLRISPDKSDMKHPIEVSVTVRNSGERSGTEVVQLYLQDVVASVTRPLRQLKGFERVELAPGESREVTFRLDSESISFYRRDMSYGYEPGQFKVWVGGSSTADLEGSFEVIR